MQKSIPILLPVTILLIVSLACLSFAHEVSFNRVIALEVIM